MGASLTARLGLAALVLAGLCLFSCGGHHLSALGNPGDLCTERTACTEGTECRITELGFRCVGPDGRLPESVTGPADEAGTREPEAEPDEASEGRSTGRRPAREDAR
jgi:hypothetical protein